jgi:hypothetical protein
VGGANASPSPPKIKSAPRRERTTTAMVPHQRRLQASKANAVRAIHGPSGKEVTVPFATSSPGVMFGLPEPPT